jgi:hypothetical protein
VIEHTWVDFGAEIGEQWALAPGEGRWTVELQSKTDTVTVPAGTFTECYRFFFDWGCCDNSWVEWYAPGIGPVKRLHLGFALIEYPLIRGFIHGIPVSVGETPHNKKSMEFNLYQNYPNPMPLDRSASHPGTVIRFDIAKTGMVTLEVYNLLGQKVRTLLNAPRQAGTHHVRWDGKDDAGKMLPGGVYFCRFRADNFKQVRKLVLIR